MNVIQIFTFDFTAIKSALRAGGLNPEVEEKLLTLQRYQEKQAKGEPFDPSTVPTSSRSAAGGSRRQSKKNYDSDFESSEFDDERSNDSCGQSSSKKRGNLREDDDDEWVLDTPRKYIKKADREKPEKKKEVLYVSDITNKPSSHESKKSQVVVKTNDAGAIRKNIIFCNRPSDVQSSENEKSPEKSLLAAKLKMKASQKIVMMAADDQPKGQKLQVSCNFLLYNFSHYLISRFLLRLNYSSTKKRSKSSSWKNVMLLRRICRMRYKKSCQRTWQFT